MTKGSIGLNAGIIWNLIINGEPISVEELQKQSSLTNEEFLVAIGWLARENKIEIIEEENRHLICSGCNFYF